MLSTFAELAVHKGSCCCKSLCCVLKFAEGLELDDLASIFWGAKVLVQILHRSSRLRNEAVDTRCLAAETAKVQQILQRFELQVQAVKA